MPPSGWYDDPDQPWTWRYFDGAHWTEHRSPMWVPPVRDPNSLAVWFDTSVAAVKRSTRRVGVLLVVVWLSLGALGSWLAIALFDDRRGRELRRLLDIDQRTLARTGSSTTNELTTAEAERAWELLQDIFWDALPWLIALTIAFVVLSAWSVAVTTRAVQQTADGPGALTVAALRRIPAVAGSGLVVFLLFAATWTLASIPVVLVVAADAGAAAIVLTVVFVVLLVLVVTAWLWGRLTLASVIAAAGGHGLGIGRSWYITHGRFWFVVGRLLITGLIAGALSGLVSLVNTFGQFLGFSAYLATVILLQAFTAAVAIVITVCGHASIIDQLDDPDADGNGDGPTGW
jgi:hypothetical protein